ncbi:MAG: Rieske 2Fe-2S domain-containing protein [Chloroflexota bacterium]|nr:Rieske 2Fe-2S domain-containing protein [Chloroflexota bacterium]
MADEPRDLLPQPDDAERFDRYLDALVTDGRPSPEDVAAGDEAEMARTAAELAAAAGPNANPDPAFIEQLRLRMRQADEGIAAVQTPLPVRRLAEPDAGEPSIGESAVPEPAVIGRLRISRRALLQGGIAAAAGLAAGALGMAALRPGQTTPGAFIGGDAPLVKGDGFWQAVASTDQLPPGAAVHFTTVAFAGYVVNDGGEIRALSSACTHMGCTLYFRPDWKDLRCPCHGASFNLSGWLANGRDQWKQSGGYAGDATAYPLTLPPLVRPGVKVEGGQVYVWTAQV